MATKKQPAQDSTKLKDPENWTTGDDPMTDAQRSYLHTLAEQAGEEPAKEEDLSKAEASQRIEELREKTGLATPPKAKRISPKKRRKTTS